MKVGHRLKIGCRIFDGKDHHFPFQSAIEIISGVHLSKRRKVASGNDCYIAIEAMAHLVR